MSKTIFNGEFCALYKSKESGFLKLLGLIGPPKTVSLSGYLRSENVDIGEEPKGNKEIHLPTMIPILIHMELFD